MSDKVENVSSPLDSLKWGAVISLLIGVIAANYVYEDVSILYRAIGAVVGVVIAGLLAATTVKGAQFVGFSKDSHLEIRKVVWPSRQEAVQTTMIVLVATAIVSLLLWGLDGIIVRLVSFITGLGI
jgi:preprotein translocase subunit SecE